MSRMSCHAPARDMSCKSVRRVTRVRGRPYIPLKRDYSTAFYLLLCKCTAFYLIYIYIDGRCVGLLVCARDAQRIDLVLVALELDAAAVGISLPSGSLSLSR